MSKMLCRKCGKPAERFLYIKTEFTGSPKKVWLCDECYWAYKRKVGQMMRRYRNEKGSGKTK